MKTTQNELEELYLNYLNKAFSEKKYIDYIDQESIDSPLFINTEVENGNYFNSDIRILYVGKENNGWFGKKQRESSNVLDINDKALYLEKNLDLYKRFNLGASYRTPFFTFLDLLIARLKEAGKSPGVLWSNLIRMDCSGAHSLKTEVLNIDENNILVKEIELLKPDVVLFVTGPDYDYWLEQSFNGISKTCLDGKPEREICLLKHSNLPEKSIRIYHPDRYKWEGSGYKEKLLNSILQILTD